MTEVGPESFREVQGPREGPAGLDGEYQEIRRLMTEVLTSFYVGFLVIRIPELH